MRVRRGTAPQPAAPPPAPPVPDDGYGRLSVADVLADLPSLDSEQLMLVKSLEEAGERRAVILDRVADLLVVQEAARHLANAAPTPAPATRAPAPAAPATRAPAPAAPAMRAPAPPAPATPAPARPAASTGPEKDVSPELVDQMGSLLARSTSRRGTGAPPTTALPPPAAPPPAPATGKRGDPQLPPNGLIMPGNGRRVRALRGTRTIALVVIVALVGAGAFVFWKQAHTVAPPAPAPAPARDLLAERLVTTVPAGYVRQPDSVGDTGPSDLAKAAKDDPAPDAQAFLTQAEFLHGYRRLWSTAGPRQDLVVFLYHFRTATGAAAYATRTVAFDKAKTKPPLVGVAVPGIPGAVGLTGSPTGAHTATVVFTRGPYAVQVVAQGTPTTDLVAIVQQVATAQYALLAAP